MYIENSNYDDLLQHPAWKQLRNYVLNRDSHKCRSCSKNKNLHIHHKQYHYYKKTGNKVLPWNYELKYLITLCRKCHKIGHKKYRIKSLPI